MTARELGDVEFFAFSVVVFVSIVAACWYLAHKERKRCNREPVKLVGRESLPDAETDKAIATYAKEVASAAQLAYEADLKAHPFYACDGTPRKMWEQLTEYERRAWGPAQSIPYQHNIGSFGGGKSKRKHRSDDDDDDDCLGTGWLFDCMMGM
jgi:hypothetical protein